MRTRFRTLAIILALCAGGYALAVAQPGTKAPPRSDASPAQEAPPSDSPLLVEPRTPQELFDAAVLTDRLFRPDLTKRYLAKLLQSNPSDDLLLELQSKYGPATFLQLSRNRALAPEATQLLERVTAAARRNEQNPSFLDSQIAALFGSASDRDVATQTLSNLGPIAVPRILQHIGAPKQNEQPEILVQTLVRMGEQVVPVLIGAVDSPNDLVRNGAIQALGLLHSKQALVYLLGPAFDERQPSGIREAARRALARILGLPTERGDGVSSFGAAAQIRKVARDYLADRARWPVTDGTTELWTWNQESQSMVANRVSPAIASLYTAQRLAREALAITPEDQESQVLFLACDFAWDAQSSKESVHAGPGTAHNLAMSAGPDVLARTLTLGLELGNPAVAKGALAAMAGVGARHELYGSEHLRSPLLAALDYPNPEVQYAAAVAILRANPDAHFRGSERVVEILTRAISGTSSPYAVVIDASQRRGNEMAGLLNQIGFESVTATTGREGFELAAEQGNVVLVAVEVNVVRWGLSQTLANLRADSRSAHIPILIYGPDWTRRQLEVALSRYPRVEFLPYSLTAPGIEMQVGPFLKRALAMAEPPQNRAARIADAAAWLAYIANTNRTKVFPLDSAATALMGIAADRAVYANALDAMAAIPTGAIQRQFEALAVSERLEPAIRIAAAQHLAEHIQRYGLLLTAREVNQVDAAWHSAANPELETALTAVMGTLKPNAKHVAVRLQKAAGLRNTTP